MSGAARGGSATAATHLRVSQQSASELVDERARAFANTAIRTANTLGRTPRPAVNHGLRRARRRIDNIQVERVEAA